MDGWDLPMSFGKKAKNVSSNIQAKVEKTKREEPVAPPPRAVDIPKEIKEPRVEAAATSSKVAVPAENKDDDDDDDDDEIGPVPPPATGKRKAGVNGEGVNEEEDEDEDGFDDDEEEEEDRIPVTHEIVLKDHTKPTSAIAVEPSGARLTTGSYDYDCKMWDFGGMDSRLKPFKSWEPNGNYFIHDLSYSPDGKYLLVVSGTTYVKVFTRDGDEPLEFAKGDVYLRDMKNTKGHTAEINSGSWHPSDSNLFLTCSNDSTLRIWDINDRSKQKHVIVVKSRDRGARTRVTACAWSPDGKFIVGGCLDGALHIWSTSSTYARPDRSNENAHTKNVEITCVAFSPDGKKLVSRSADDSIKVWDIKSLRQPLATASGLANIYPETGIGFSPDGQYILAGTAVNPKDPDAVGELVFLGIEDLSVRRRVPIAKGASVIRVYWHTRINQIFCTLSNGSVYVLYSPHSSIHGALLPLSKMPRTAPRDLSFSSADIKPVIFTPDALPMFRDQRYGESLHQKEKKAKKFKPQEPVSGHGKGGRIGSAATAGLVQSMFTKHSSIDEDPREALLKYATKEEQEKRKQYQS